MKFYLFCEILWIVVIGLYWLLDGFYGFMDCDCFYFVDFCEILFLKVLLGT